MKQKILVIDDDTQLTGVLSLALTAEGYEVRTADHGQEGLKHLFDWQPDLIVLDVMMPRMDGWRTCERIREFSDVPVLMLTAKAGEFNEIRGLGYGADSYMTKPFAVQVLLARIGALLRRSKLQSSGPAGQVIRIGRLVIDTARHEVTVDGQVTNLTPTEFRVLTSLATKPGQVVSPQELLARVWGEDYAGDNYFVKLYISYLRKKIEKDPSRPRYIMTKRGVGYYLDSGVR